jgi:hypothetical protein
MIRKITPIGPRPDGDTDFPEKIILNNKLKRDDASS